MELIRTPKGKLYGTFDKSNYILYIKDGSKTACLRSPFI